MNLADYLRENEISQSTFAEQVGVTQGRVSQWLRGQTIPAEKCLAIESATLGKVTRGDLRPDLWPVAHKRKAA